MADVKDYKHYGEELERLLLLETSPIAVKFLEKPEDVPNDAVRPKRDRGYHLAQCQAFSMSRRQGLTIALLKEDHWCWAPLLAYGIVPPETEHPGLKVTVKKLAVEKLERDCVQIACTSQRFFKTETHERPACGP
jgi:uncharacterized protein (DUF169 family)